MLSRLISAATLILVAFAIAAPARASIRSDARRYLAAGQGGPAVLLYKEISADRSTRPDLVSEYALALALAGIDEGALFELDRAFMLDPMNPDVLYAGSTMLAALGMKEAAADIARPAPQGLVIPWQAFSKQVSTRQDAIRDVRTYQTEIALAHALLVHGRYVTAAARYVHVARYYPSHMNSWAGLAIALEKIGCYKAAAQAVARQRTLAENRPEKFQELLATHEQELEARAPLGSVKANEALSGRYTFYAGGGLNVVQGTESNTVDGNINLQVGKFLTSRFNLGANMGYDGNAGFTIGVLGRFYQPLPTDAPISFTAGTGINYESSTFGFILSPGLSYFLQNSSVDLVLDIGIAGAQSGVLTFSLGYTVYVGGGA